MHPTRNLSQAEWDRFIGARRPYEHMCAQHPSGLGAPMHPPPVTEPRPPTPTLWARCTRENAPVADNVVYAPAVP
jgi:hypothetical protein